MKPLSWNLGAAFADDAWRQLKKFSPKGKRIMSHGEVLNGPKISLELAQSAVKDAFEVLAAYDFRAIKTDRVHYTATDLAVAWGNVGIHVDDGLGKVALILLRVEPFSRSRGCQFMDSPFTTESYLWTKHGLIAMEEGGMVVFDADQEHAWFCPGVATFLSIAVTKAKKPVCGLLRPSA
jgi:hypothetical protein